MDFPGMRSGEFCRSQRAARWFTILSIRTRVWGCTCLRLALTERYSMSGLERRMRAPSLWIPAPPPLEFPKIVEGLMNFLVKKEPVLSQDDWCIATHPRGIRRRVTSWVLLGLGFKTDHSLHSGSVTVRLRDTWNTMRTDTPKRRYRLVEDWRRLVPGKRKGKRPAGPSFLCGPQVASCGSLFPLRSSGSGCSGSVMGSIVCSLKQQDQLPCGKQGT